MLLILEIEARPQNPSNYRTFFFFTVLKNESRCQSNLWFHNLLEPAILSFLRNYQLLLGQRARTYRYTVFIKRKNGQTKKKILQKVCKIQIRRNELADLWNHRARTEQSPKNLSSKSLFSIQVFACGIGKREKKKIRRVKKWRGKKNHTVAIMSGVLKSLLEEGGPQTCATNKFQKKERKKQKEPLYWQLYIATNTFTFIFLSTSRFCTHHGFHNPTLEN